MTPGAQHVAVRVWAWSVSLAGFAWTLWAEYPGFTPTDRIAGWLMALAFFVTAATPSILLHIRTRSADRRAEREAKWQRHDLNNRLTQAVNDLALLKRTAADEAERLKKTAEQLKKALAEKDTRITDLEQQVVENRQYQNQTRTRVHPPLPEIPEGPVDRRLSESGQFPVVPEVSD